MTPAELWHYEQQQKMLHEPNPFLTEESDLFESVGEGEDGPIILPVSISTVEDTPVTGPVRILPTKLDPEHRITRGIVICLTVLTSLLSSLWILLSLMMVHLLISPSRVCPTSPSLTLFWT